MPDLFEYFDYKKYLADYYIEKKKNNPRFSYKSFTDKCGFKNKSFLHQIINTSKQISKSSIFNISKAIGFSKKESDYFEHLVAFNQAKTLDEKNHFYNELMAINAYSKTAPAGRIIKKDQYEYYSKWHYGAIRSLIGMYGFKNDYRWLAASVYPAISMRDAKKAVALLERLGFIKKGNVGCYKIADDIITTGDEVVSTAVLKFHQQSSALARDALNKLPREIRNITGLMLGISPKGYQEICKKLAEYRKELLTIAQKDKDAKMVYQLNLHLFPLSDPRLLKVNSDLEKKL